MIDCPSYEVHDGKACCATAARLVHLPIIDCVTRPEMCAVCLREGGATSLNRMCCSVALHAVKSNPRLFRHWFVKLRPYLRDLTPQLRHGVGRIVRDWLRLIGVSEELGCRCNARAARMNDGGRRWCLWRAPSIAWDMAHDFYTTWPGARLPWPLAWLGATLLIWAAVAWSLVPARREPKA